MRKDLIVKWFLVIALFLTAIVIGFGSLAFENFKMMAIAYMLAFLGVGLARW